MGDRSHERPEIPSYL